VATLILGDCLEKLKELDANSIDSVVTDPPYGLKFMNKHWDYDVPKVEIWKEVFRVLKPGGHVLSFGGTRTYHRMVVNIEDAGFEIRDAIQWIYGSGFPKSHDISKAIDKTKGFEPLQGELNPAFREKQLEHEARWKTSVRPLYKTLPSSNEAKEWKGWGTALKPSCEIICLARKPLEKGLTVAENVLRWGTGAINVDESRIDYVNDKDAKEGRSAQISTSKGMEFFTEGEHDQFDRSKRDSIQGRWPANTIFDEETAALLDEQSGELQSRPNKNPRPVGKFTFVNQKEQDLHRQQYETTKGGASRFFYCAKASKRERNAGLEGMPLVESGIKNDSGRGFSESDPHKKILNQNHHPTVKPLKLMEYLIKLITPPHGTILDPFMGSGSTGVAAKKLNFEFMGIELSEEYSEIAKKRIEEMNE
jgi:site-specific DNA-methyltransferase (adenine-specific)